MPDIRPLRALFFDPRKAGPLEKLVAEPYDKVTEAMRAAYLEGAPHNIVRVDLPREQVDGQDRYRTAAATYRGWIEKGIVRREERAAFYLYEQGFELPGEPRLTRRAIVGLIEAREHGEGHVLPHERTFREPKADRMALLEALRAHFGMCFLLYQDGDGAIRAAIEQGLAARKVAPVADFQLPDRTSHRLTPIEDAGAITALRALFAGRTCTIADGHHRFETAIAFRRAHEAAGDAKPGHAYRTAAFVDVLDPGLRILPTHRLLPKEITPAVFAERTARYLAPEADLAKARFVVEGADGAQAGYSLAPHVDLAKELPEVPEAVRSLDVTVLHRLLLEKAFSLEAGQKEHSLGYVRWPEEGRAKLKAGQNGALVCLRGTSAADVLRVAAAGAVMPQKSTDFYPKLLSGLVMNDIEDATHG